jgi:uncharacterized protein YcfJ
MKIMEFLKKYWPMALLPLFSGCDTTESTLGGAVLGTAAGAGVGHAVGGRGGAVLGGVLGALGGGAVGHNVGRSNEEKNAAIAENSRLRAQNSAMENSGDSYRKEEIRQLNYDIERQRLENEKKRLELENQKLGRN